jgi:hypothetical protein
MRTLAQLQRIIETGSDAQKLEASMEITNFMLAYNAEYNLLIDLEAAAKIEHWNVSHDPAGIDHPRRLELEALLTNVASRMAFLDMKMLAFEHSSIGINAPDQATIYRVKAISDTVARTTTKNQAVVSILAAITEIAKIVDGTMS